MNFTPLTTCRVGIARDKGMAALPPDEAYRDGARVAALIRRAVLESGLGVPTRRDAPLAALVRPGATVLLKPNFVFHVNGTGAGMECLVTPPTFVLAALEEVLKAKPARVIIGDAPIQGCLFDDVATGPFRRAAGELAAAAGASLTVVDFRRTVLDASSGATQQVGERRDMTRFVLFDLAAESLLEPVSHPKGRFRVTSYDPRGLALTHGPGRHRFLLCREAFEADVILSLPKLKTHRKAGMTGALKNLVGLNGEKAYLPHHRAGGSASGGDCYPGRSVAKRFGEFLLDAANRRLNTRSYGLLRRLALRVRRHVATMKEGELEGGWYGNDTCWRMVLDLNRIARYGRCDGTLAERPQREIWSLTDAIVCGQGEGPLLPTPLDVGVVTFAASPAAADVVHAALLHFDPDRIALVREAFGAFAHGLGVGRGTVRARFEGRELDPADVARELGVDAEPPAGWKGHVEWKLAR